jgi:hypothetical protein
MRRRRIESATPRRRAWVVASERKTPVKVDSTAGWSAEFMLLRSNPAIVYTLQLPKKPRGATYGRRTDFPQTRLSNSASPGPRIGQPIGQDIIHLAVYLKFQDADPGRASEVATALDSGSDTNGHIQQGRIRGQLVQSTYMTENRLLQGFEV